MTNEDDPIRHHPELRGKFLDPLTFQLGNIDMDETARMLTAGEGVPGNGLAYAENLAGHFSAFGIEDAYLFEVLACSRRLRT